ncbi:FkbM family methyltransferase [Moorena sp. SIO3I8]|uniref:FkbM family methyltransferase n=1 Tax=Moorena sp. SIO3I8 TaxID=2607833 RepID=UPI0013C006CF|nr:FkbM family methyltransferase [Moorena sp. SIO3I8]NEO05717.1 FkbM family methyltransferase [Moorena sp. SIO3I8]
MVLNANKLSEITIKLTATLTAEPLNKSVNLWMEDINIPSKINLSKSNQHVEQILDKSSLISTQKNGCPVISSSFEDWIRSPANQPLSPNHSNLGLATNFDILKAEALLANHNDYQLPNHLVIVHENEQKTDELYQDIFEKQTYIKHGITIHDGDCIFDIGANIGMFTLFAQQICKNARLFSFEALPDVFELLQINASLYGSNAKVFSFGLSKHSKTISSIIHQQNIEKIDLLKINADQPQLDILAGIKEKDWEKIQQIVIEVDQITAGIKLKQITNLLQRKGYQLVIDQEVLLADTGVYRIYASRNYQLNQFS